ncbi:hypothetical protein BH11PLA2_BH11PLA2_12130 [soil metagenome]
MVMETAILDGHIDAVLDLDLTDLIDGTHPDRLTAAGLKRIPQVIVPGGLSHLPDKRLDLLGKEIAEKACAAGGPTLIVLGSDTLRVLRESISNWIYPPSLLMELNLTCEDEAFVKQCVSELLKLMASNSAA